MRRRDRMEKRRMAPETNQKRYAEDYYYADTADLDRYRMSNDPFSDDYQRNRMRQSEDEEEILARKLAKKKHKKREKERYEA